MRNFYQRSSTAALLIAALLIGGGVTVQAQDGDGASTLEQLQEQVQQLQEQVAELRERLRSRGSNVQSADTVEPVERDNPPVMIEQDFDAEEMEVGDRGERVRELQRLLAEDESIYPEGLATGYYGNLTAQAVARLQQRIGIPDDGEFNDETMSRIRDLIENGAGNSGITPPGLLTAPGIQRLLGASEDADSDDDDDGGDEEVESNDRRRGPDIDSMSIPEELKERLRAIFNRFDSDDDDKDDNDDDDELEIEAEVEDGETEVEIEYPDGTEEEFTFDTTNRDEVIARIVAETDLTEEEIEAVLEFEIDDEDEDEDDDNDNNYSDDDDDENEN